MRKGSDGFRKCFQIDEQNLVDIEDERESGIRKNEQRRKKLLLRWKAGKDFQKSVCRKKVWNSDDVLDGRKINGTEAGYIIKFFAIEGFSNKSKQEKIQKVIDTRCTKLSFAATKADLIVLMRENGIEEEWEDCSLNDDDSMDSSGDEEDMDEEIEEEILHGMFFINCNLFF